MPYKKKVEYSEDEDIDIDDHKPPKKQRAPKRKLQKDEGSEIEDESDKPKKRTPKAKAGQPTSKEPYTAVDGWNVVPPSVLHRSTCSRTSDKVAAFDLDGTIAVVKSSLQFPRTAEDYKFFNKDVVKTVKQLYEDGFKVLIFSNQGGIKSALEGAMATKLKARADLIVAELGCPVTVFYATMDDEYRKPGTAMWDLYLEKYSPNCKPDMKGSFFVGDAAGRPDDIADTDKGFAEAVGLPFRTPEDVFGEGLVKKAPPKPGAGSEPANQDMANAFNQLAELAQAKAGVFQARAYKKAADVIASWPSKIKCGKDLAKTQGIGKGSVSKIDEFLSSGTLEALTEANVAPIPVAPPNDAGQGSAFAFA